jgi:glucose-6-phosphate isomerase
MPRFLELKTVQKLKKLAEEPIDLSKEGSLTPERIAKLRLSMEGFDLLFGTERVTEQVMDALYELAEDAQALKKMASMQSGEILNKIENVESENRSVLHTAMRDQFENKQTSLVAAEAREMAQKELKKLEKFLAKLDLENKFTDIVQIGIGGSDLGPRAIYLALEAFARPDRRAHFISNVDPDDATAVLGGLDLNKTLVVVVSKSGSTLETVTNEEIARSMFKKKGLDPKKHVLAVTGEKSPMDDPSRYLASFYIWDFIGGRYSATSMVGAVTLGFALGFNGLQEFLKGAHTMDRHALTAPLKENLPLTSALLGVWNRNFLNLPTVAINPYSQALIRFPAHLQQLDMESNGKRIDKTGKAADFATGPVIWGEPGTNGQPSFYQLIHQGTNIVPREFLGFRKSQRARDLEVESTLSQEKLLSNLFAQSIALAGGQKNDNPNKFFPGNRPNRILLADRLDPFTAGAILAYYEHKVAFQGFIWNINSFDQEGVQLGKVLAMKIIDLFKARRTKEAAAPFPLGEAYLKISNEKH